MVALTSKTYICFENNNSEASVTSQREMNIKLASKGLSKSLNHLTKKQYLDVLETMTCGGGINRGFKTDGKQVVTYEQRRDALPYLYIKRKVGSDGITTEPIDL